MKELQFIALREAEWKAWDEWLTGTRINGRPTQATRRKLEAGAPPLIALDELPRRFRTLCQDLSIARDRNYSSTLQDALHDRVLAVHQRIYAARPRAGNAVLAFILHGFPELVRREWRLVMASALLFFGPAIAIILILQYHPDAVYLFLSPEMTGQLEDMYAPTAEHLGRPREATTDWMMWGFYIANNVRIDFQCFAGGVLFGVGSLFFIIYNALHIGAAAGHLTQLGYIETFWGFVAGHSAFELTGVVISGAAGLRLGLALIAPGQRTRLESLRYHARDAVRLIYGAAGLTFLAAFIEAFWSPLRGVPVSVKYGVGITLWTLTILYFIFVGRQRRAS